ncbi:MAG: MAPEG family protein [Gammaproteobacteria bacterium]|nr:MAPEG family protein [Gammaproteobacteria bacterium]
MITSFYAAMLALLIVWLSLRVIRMRWAKKVRLGDGGDSELQAAIRAQGNAAEYVPLSLVLLALLELGGAHMALLHAGGLSVLVGRLLHARGLLTETLHYRKLGMQITIFALIGLALANLVYAVLGGLGMIPPHA